jgi:hypothetical protein
MLWVHLIKAHVKATMGRFHGGMGCMTPSAKLGSIPCEVSGGELQVSGGANQKVIQV